MPTYGYRCTKCDHQYERFQKISNTRVPRCPRCKGKGERLISGGVGFVLKGSGFYATDYKRAAEKKTESEPKKSAAEGETKKSSSQKDDKPSKASGAET